MTAAALESAAAEAEAEDTESVSVDAKWIHLPGGGTAPVQLPADAAPGTVVQMQMRCVQLRPMKEEEIEVVVPSTVKYNRAFRVALPGGGTKVVTAPAGVKAGAAMKVTVKVPVE